MKVLVVGGAGYVGSVLVRGLLEKGYDVKVLDRLYFGDRGIKDLLEEIELLVCDMRRITPSILEDVDAVINVGGLSNDPTAEYNPKANFQMNTIASSKLAQMCRETGVKRYIFASTCSIYDRGVLDSEADIVLSENSPVFPKAAYSLSKFEAERRILALSSDDFCPVILRKGTIFGFSPRMRYDLVVNTFVKDAFSKGYLTLFMCGEMWRPLVEVRDVTRAYIAALEADEREVKGQIFNVSYRNFRISELALRVRDALREIGMDVDIRLDRKPRTVRSYRVSNKKIKERLSFEAKIPVEESVTEMIRSIKEYGYTDFENPIYYNIRWMKLIEKTQGDVFEIGGYSYDRRG